MNCENYVYLFLGLPSQNALGTPLVSANCFENYLYLVKAAEPQAKCFNDKRQK